jgi:hypothetical protein
MSVLNVSFVIREVGSRYSEKLQGKHTRAATAKYVYTSTTSEIPDRCSPSSAWRVQDIAYVTGVGVLERQLLPATDEKIHWIIKNVQFPDNVVSEIATARVVQAVSDGSFKESFGTAAWTINVSDQCVLNGHCITPGNPSDQSAYRSKLTGIYGIACTIRYLFSKYGIAGHIIVGCDGLSALRQAQKAVDFVDPNSPQFDIIMAIHLMIAQSSWQWDWIHVKGHQDDSKPRTELNQWSLWNIQMDEVANRCWKTTKHQYIDPIIQGEPSYPGGRL